MGSRRRLFAWLALPALIVMLAGCGGCFGIVGISVGCS